MKLSNLACSILVLTFLLAFATSVRADTYTVTTTADTGAGSLRAAVDSANTNPADDTINFDASLSGQTITLASQIVINNAGTLTITGLGANVLTIDGGSGTNRIFDISTSAVVTITDVTLTGGDVSTLSGGAVRVGNSASLTVERVYFTGNTEGGNGGGAIGATQNGVTLKIRHSTFSNNSTTTSTTGGGAIYIGGSSSSVTVVNSTFSNNSAPNNVGGAIYISSPSSTLTLRNTTISGNSAKNGGGVAFAGNFNFANNIIAGNTVTAGQPEIFNDAITAQTSQGNNLVGDSSGDSTDTGFSPITYQVSDKRDMNPQLGSLTIANGGPTPTRALLSGSPAIDAGNNAQAVDPSNGNAALTTDQRGFQRIANGNFAGTIVDIGAFEVQPATAAAVSISGRVLAGNGRGIAKAVVYLTDSQGNTRTVLTSPFGYYQFEDVMAGQNVIVTVAAKGYQFSPQVLSVSEDLIGVNFTAKQ